jgi:hypothetical protein
LLLLRGQQFDAVDLPQVDLDGEVGRNGSNPPREPASVARLRRPGRRTALSKTGANSGRDTLMPLGQDT